MKSARIRNDRKKIPAAAPWGTLFPTKSLGTGYFFPLRTALLPAGLPAGVGGHPPCSLCKVPPFLPKQSPVDNADWDAAVEEALASCLERWGRRVVCAER